MKGAILLTKTTSSAAHSPFLGSCYSITLHKIPFWVRLFHKSICSKNFLDSSFSHTKKQNHCMDRCICISENALNGSYVYLFIFIIFLSCPVLDDDYSTAINLRASSGMENEWMFFVDQGVRVWRDILVTLIYLLHFLCAHCVFVIILSHTCMCL